MADHRSGALPDPFVGAAAAPSSLGFGVRAPALLGDYYAENRRQSRAMMTPPARRSRPQAPLRVFVGGALDNVQGRNAEDEYERYLASDAGPAEYFTHLSVPSIVGAIRRGSQDGAPVDVIGHSYGAMAAFNAVNQAAQQGYAVRNLVTADPVGRLSTGKGPLPPGRVGRWTNIEATPPGLNVSDVVALIGGKPSAVPTSYADQGFVVQRHHQDLAGMIGDAGGEGLFSAPGASLDDDLGPEEWNRRRTVQVVAGRKGRR